MTKKFTKKELAEFEQAKQSIQSLGYHYDGKKAKQYDYHIVSIAQRNSSPEYTNSIIKRTQSKEWREANLKSVLKTVQTESWKNNHAAAVEAWKNDPQWQQEQQERIERRSNNPVWKERKTEASRRLAKDETWLANTTKALRTRCAKPIVTPAGIFAALTDAGLAYNKIRNFNNGRKWVINQLKVNPSEFYYITKEEYIMLTGREI